MGDTSNNSAHGEDPFSWALPEELALEFGFTSKWKRLVRHIEPIRADHGRGEGEPDCGSRLNFPFARLDLDFSGFRISFRLLGDGEPGKEA